MRTHTVIDSPVGPLTLVATDGVLCGVYMDQQRHRPPQETFKAPDAGPFAECVRQLEGYFAGRRERIGRPAAARAVGLANGRNPVGIVVPCHRVVGSSGALTGYGGGLERKRQLLDFEREVVARGRSCPAWSTGGVCGAGVRRAGPRR
ncbi:methylated-DNA--[protein]-cysteine S-methyltransferase [Saccharopolyspora erythraea]|uniref:methylated-DNA--[protein]-cysteine S-methyltransferase n=1 Tax=Saccharopolyspora erythraea TaxID=1836 RepID=UPI00193DB547|nr:methylated-DNA--[protein]-cysteine S-methyltransferase [Saccharopolyspora erythraea]QRK93138.1 methylated-DNA--[protein]-cysteine S-methyltransferase [Saccharopolyspora erythraea]